MSDERDLHEILVLAVDDTEDNLDLLEEMLEEEVWSVLRASSGEQAIKLAKEHQPDIVLLDLNMPGMNGLSVVRAIRSIDTLHHIGIILQTAHADRDNVLTAIRLGCSHILGKPLDRGRVLAEIRSCMSEQPKRPPRKQPTESVEQSKPKTIAVSLDDALEAIEAGELTEIMNDPHTIDCLHELVAADSPVGKRLIKVANSPSYAGSRRVESVAQAIVRIGTRKTRELISKAAALGQKGLGSSRSAAVVKLLEVITRVFPDRTSTVEDTRALLRELSGAAQARRRRAQAEEASADSDTTPEDRPVTDPMQIPADETDVTAEDPAADESPIEQNEPVAAKGDTD